MSDKLVLYFSVYGSTKKIAKELAAQTGADLQEIEPAVPYDGNRDHYSALLKVAEREHDTDARPEIKNELNIADHDTIYIGYPMWCYTFPMIIYTLFDQYDFSGKTIIPFNTHMGSGDGGTYQTIRELEPDAEVIDGFPVQMRDAENHAASAVAKGLSAMK